MPEFYGDFCDTGLARDSPSARKMHCSGRTHKENVKGRAQKRMEEQAQSLAVKTTAALRQGKLPPTAFSAPPPAGATIPPLPGMMPAPHMEAPPMMPMMGPPPGMMPVGPAPGMRLPMGGHMPMMPGPSAMRPPARPVVVPTWPGMTGSDR